MSRGPAGRHRKRSRIKRQGGDKQYCLEVFGFSPADAELLSLFAAHAAVAIQNARLYEAEQRTRRTTETFEALLELEAATSSAPTGAPLVDALDERQGVVLLMERP